MKTLGTQTAAFSVTIYNKATRLNHKGAQENTKEEAQSDCISSLPGIKWLFFLLIVLLPFFLSL